MNLTTQKRIAARILKVGISKVRFDPEKLSEIKEAITKADINGLIKEGTITKKPLNFHSRSRARKLKEQKIKGNRKGPGSKKGTKNARANAKTLWVRKIRLLRSFIRELRGKNLIESKDYRPLILKSKGGFFRSKRHLKLYLSEHRMVKQK